MSSGGDEGGRERLAMLGEIAVEIAHELRNVLQVISSSAYVARQEATKGDAAATLPHVVKIEKNARMAHGIVDDLMALARSEALPAESVLLAEVMVAARSELPPGCANWDDQLEPRDLRVRVHAGLLVRVLHVLYDNAVQASAPRMPRIATSAVSAGGRTVIDVADDGPGIPEAISARVFEPLVTARPGGTGLGLPLARRIVAAHGGSIILVPSADGAIFRIELPDRG
jgi:two-component system C4-dicarboxylate transport sensor histidine kinase DctB